jgi:hypothetical protein
MPCSDCGSLLIVNHDHRKLFCPFCSGLEIEDQDIVNQKVEDGLDFFRDDRLIGVVENYSKGNLLLYLIERLNIVAHGFFESRRLDLTEFSYLNHLIKIIFPRSGFGDDHLDRGDELNEVIDIMIKSQSSLVKNLKHSRDGFNYCVPRPVPDDQPFFGEYDLYDTEYNWAYYRCLRSLGCGLEEDVDLFDEVHREIRDYDKPDGSMFDSLDNFVKIAFEFIVNMLFIASADDVVGNIYETWLPSEVTVLDLYEFFEHVNRQFENARGALILQDSKLGMASEEEVDAIGEHVFEDLWPDVKEKIIVSESNLEAHPFLFKIDVEKLIKRVPGRDPITREVPRIIYPRFYDFVLLFQLFPLLENGEQDTGHDLLSSENKRRGQMFERNLFEYLQRQGFECYHSAEIRGSDREEIDVLVVNEEDGELWFIEAKHVLPETDMNTSEGIENLNGKYDFKVFNEEDAYIGEPTGDPFPEKVEVWLELEQGDEFTSQTGPEDTDREPQYFQEEWLELDVVKLVVSNLTPSYVEKHGVRFLTDLEFFEYLEGDRELYELRH